MRASRRTSVVNRHTTHSSPTQNSSFPANPRLQKCLDGMNFNYSRGIQADLISPKHISISYPTADHELVYETVVLFSAVAAFLLQLLHIYRTVWWLPQSYEQNALVQYNVTHLTKLDVISSSTEILLSQPLHTRLRVFTHHPTLDMGGYKDSSCESRPKPVEGEVCNKQSDSFSSTPRNVTLLHNIPSRLTGRGRNEQHFQQVLQSGMPPLPVKSLTK